MSSDLSSTSPVPSHQQQQSSVSLLSHHSIALPLNHQQKVNHLPQNQHYQRFPASAPTPDPSRTDYFDFDVSLSALDVVSSPSEASSDGDASPMDPSASAAFMTMRPTSNRVSTTSTPGRTSTKRSSPSSTPTPTNQNKINASTNPHSHYHHPQSQHYSTSTSSFNPTHHYDCEPAPKRTLRHRTARPSISASTSATTTAPTSPSAYPSPPDTLSTTTATASNSKTPTTRLPHNQVEKKYREGLNTELERLHRAVPTLPQRSGGTARGSEAEYSTSGGRPPKPSKATILASAVEYIKFLEAENERLVGLNEELRGTGQSERRGGVSSWRREMGRGGEW